MLTWGIMFFSTASWNNGGGGRSTARNRNGDTVVLISVVVPLTKSTAMADGDLGARTSIDIEPRFLVLT